jgi:hypothetical protein
MGPPPAVSARPRAGSDRSPASFQRSSDAGRARVHRACGKRFPAPGSPHSGRSLGASRLRSSAKSEVRSPRRLTVRDEVDDRLDVRCASGVGCRADSKTQPSPRSSSTSGNGEPTGAMRSLGRIAGSASVAHSFSASPTANPAGARKRRSCGCGTCSPELGGPWSRETGPSPSRRPPLRRPRLSRRRTMFAKIVLGVALKDAAPDAPQRYVWLKPDHTHVPFQLRVHFQLIGVDATAGSPRR